MRPQNLINQKSGRESIEWSNFWIDDANKETEKRILLFGDSTSRDIRSTMSRMLHCPMDLFASSSALRDEMFWNQLDDFFSSNCYKYDYIFVQVGNHSRRAENGVDLFGEYDYRRFESDFTCLLNYLLQHSSKIIVEPSTTILVKKKQNGLVKWSKLILHWCFKIKFHQEIDQVETGVAEKKNAIMQNVAHKMNLPWCDINAFMNTTYFMKSDNIHYERRARATICRHLATFAGLI